MNMRFFEAISIGKNALSDVVDGQDDLLKMANTREFTDFNDLETKIDYIWLTTQKESKLQRLGLITCTLFIPTKTVSTKCYQL